MSDVEPRKRSLIRNLALRLILRGKKGRKARGRMKLIRGLALIAIVGGLAQRADIVQSLLLGASRPAAASVSMRLPALPSLSTSGPAATGRAVSARAEVPQEMEAAARVGTLLAPSGSGSGGAGPLPPMPEVSAGTAALADGLQTSSGTKSGLPIEPGMIAGNAPEGLVSGAAQPAAAGGTMAPAAFPDALPSAAPAKVAEAVEAVPAAAAKRPPPNAMINCVAGCGATPPSEPVPLTGRQPQAPVDRSLPCVAGCMPVRQ